MVNKHKQKKKKNFRTYGKSNKELIALIEKIFQKSVKKEKEENGEGTETLSRNADLR